MTDTDDFARNRAFSRGCDARILGIPQSHNPYTGWDERNERRSWVAGWWDAHSFWGCWRPSWMKVSPRPLPPIQGKVA